MIITRRSFLTGLLAAPIILRPGIIMPVRPLVIEPRYFGYGLPKGTMIIKGVDAFGFEIVETLVPGKIGQKVFNYISGIEYVGGEVVEDHPFIGQFGTFTAINMRRPS